VQQAARENGYFVSVASVREVNPTSIGDALGHLMEQSLDGVIAIVPHQAAEQPLSTLAKSVPVVAVGLIGNGSLSTVNFDQSTGVRLAVQHLVKLGHSSFAHVCGSPDWADASARIKGWQETLAEKGLPSSLLLRGDWSAASGYLVGVQLAVSRQATAVFAANDQMALGVLRAFAEAGVRVPEDISVVGFDDQPEAAHFLPPLTTVQQDFTELGTRCMKQLLHTMAGENNPTDLLLKPRLIVRSSTDIPTR
jgi:DNA-binding LacI/PurR family transcriptional regulator